MSRPVHIEWLPTDDSAVCLPQNRATPGALVISGTLASNGVATFTNVERAVSITSAGNAAVNFTIAGTRMGKVVSETLVGPNAGTVETVGTFTTVTSVTVDAGFAAPVSLGTGTFGTSIWFLNDYQRTQCSVGIYVGIAGNVIYSLESTYDDPALVEVTQGFALVDGVTVPTVPAATPMINANASINTNLTIPVFASRVFISASDNTGQAVFYFMQQGIR